MYENIGYTGQLLGAIETPIADYAMLNDTTWIKQNSSYVEYDFVSTHDTSAKATVYALPTHPLNNHYKMRYAISIDNGALQVIDFKTVGRSEEWKQNVLRNRAEKTISLKRLRAGNHTLRIYAIDPGVMLDAILINTGGLKPSYSTIPETR